MLINCAQISSYYIKGTTIKVEDLGCLVEANISLNGIVSFRIFSYEDGYTLIKSIRKYVNDFTINCIVDFDPRLYVTRSTLGNPVQEIFFKINKNNLINYPIGDKISELLYKKEE